MITNTKLFGTRVIHGLRTHKLGIPCVLCDIKISEMTKPPKDKMMRKNHTKKVR